MKIMFRDALIHNFDEYEEITMEQLKKFKNEALSDRYIELENIDLNTNTMFFCLTYY